jgi:hypothetical protein
MMGRKQIDGGERPCASKTLWAYGYELSPPRREDLMAEIQGLLDRENGEAKRGARTWTGRLVTEQQATHVLIVSTSPEMDLDINRELEAELKVLGIDFRVTVPIPVGEKAEPVEP